MESKGVGWRKGLQNCYRAQKWWRDIVGDLAWSRKRAGKGEMQNSQYLAWKWTEQRSGEFTTEPTGDYRVSEEIGRRGDDGTK